MSFTHRVALITGSASGIGRAVAHAFVNEGCTRLILADIDEKGLAVVEKELEELNPSVLTCSVVCDTSSETDVQRMVDEGLNQFGAIHYAVNNAGVSNKPRAPIHELELSAFDRVQNINLRGVWLCERAEIRQMLKQDTDLTMKYEYRSLMSFSVCRRSTTTDMLTFLQGPAFCRGDRL